MDDRCIEVNYPFIVMILGVCLYMYLVYQLYSSEYYFEYDIPLQGLDQAEVTEVDFSVATDHDRYRMSLYFSPPASDSIPPDSITTDSIRARRALVESCLRQGTSQLRTEDAVVSEKAWKGPIGSRWHLVENREHDVFLFSDLTLEPETRYEMTLHMPEFTSRCQALNPRVVLSGSHRWWY